MPLGAGDCERLHDGLIAQPVNTASALAYVAVGAWVATRALGPDVPADRRRLAFGLTVAVAGIGSVDYHGPGSPAARLLHDGGLYAVTGLVAWHELVGRGDRSGWSPRRRRANRLAVALAAAGAACWWLGRTGSPWCDPDSLLQGHAAWHLLGAAALAVWGWAVLLSPTRP